MLCKGSCKDEPLKDSVHVRNRPLQIGRNQSDWYDLQKPVLCKVYRYWLLGRRTIYKRTYIYIYIYLEKKHSYACLKSSFEGKLRKFVIVSNKVLRKDSLGWNLVPMRSECLLISFEMVFCYRYNEKWLSQWILK